MSAPTGAREHADCLVCQRSLAVNADGRLRKHGAAGGGVCRGSGRPTNRMLDDRDRELSRLRTENAALRVNLIELRRATDVGAVWAELTSGDLSDVESAWLREFDSFDGAASS